MLNDAFKVVCANGLRATVTHHQSDILINGPQVDTPNWVGINHEVLDRIVSKCLSPLRKLLRCREISPIAEIEHDV